MDRFEWIATAAFGLEGLVARELARLGIEAKAENGGGRTGCFPSHVPGPPAVSTKSEAGTTPGGGA